MESLLATGLFAFIVSVVLLQLSISRHRQVAYLAEEELYQLVKIAAQTDRSHLVLNGQEVTLVETEQSLKVYQKGELLIEVEED